MKAILALLLLAFVYSIPNPVYTIKGCFEKLYDVKANSELELSVKNELLKWKVDEFYEKVNRVDPTLKGKIETIKTLVFLKILTSGFTDVEIEVLNNSFGVINNTATKVQKSLDYFDVVLKAYRRIR